MATPTKMAIVFSFLTVAFLGVACAEEDEDTAINSWQGTEPHLIIKGTLNGEDLDINITGAEAADLANFHCERNYHVPVDEDTGEEIWDQGTFDELKLRVAGADVNGELRDIEIEFKEYDFFSGASAGTAVTIVPRDDSVVPAANEMWLEWEWYAAGDLDDGEQYYEEAAQSGSVTIEELTGELADNGLVIPDNTGTFGLYAEATWSPTESLVISATANCGVNDF